MATSKTLSEATVITVNQLLTKMAEITRTAAIKRQLPGFVFELRRQTDAGLKISAIAPDRRCVITSLICDLEELDSPEILGRFSIRAERFVAAVLGFRANVYWLEVPAS